MMCPGRHGREAVGCAGSLPQKHKGRRHSGTRKGLDPMLLACLGRARAWVWRGFKVQGRPTCWGRGGAHLSVSPSLSARSDCQRGRVKPRSCKPGAHQEAMRRGVPCNTGAWATPIVDAAVTCNSVIGIRVQGSPAEPRACPSTGWGGAHLQSDAVATGGGQVKAADDEPREILRQRRAVAGPVGASAPLPLRLGAGPQVLVGHCEGCKSQTLGPLLHREELRGLEHKVKAQQGGSHAGATPL